MDEKENAIESISSRDQSEERISEIEDKDFEIIQSEEKKRMKE